MAVGVAEFFLVLDLAADLEVGPVLFAEPRLFDDALREVPQFEGLQGLVGAQVGRHVDTHLPAVQLPADPFAGRSGLNQAQGSQGNPVVRDPVVNGRIHVRRGLAVPDHDDFPWLAHKSPSIGLHPMLYSAGFCGALSLARRGAPGKPDRQESAKNQLLQARWNHVGSLPPSAAV